MLGVVVVVVVVFGEGLEVGAGLGRERRVQYEWGVGGGVREEWEKETERERCAHGAGRCGGCLEGFVEVARTRDRSFFSSLRENVVLLWAGESEVASLCDAL